MHPKFLFRFTGRVLFPLLLISSGEAQAQTSERAVDDAFALTACLDAWGTHPFGSHLNYTTLATSVKLSGAAPSAADQTATDHPSLVLVQPSVGARGDAPLALLNPNGWYCLATPASQLSALRVQLHCRAHMAAASGGATSWGMGGAGAGPTKIGSIQVDRVGCR